MTFDLAKLLTPTHRQGTTPTLLPHEGQPVKAVATGAWDEHCEVLRFMVTDDGMGGSIEQNTQSGKYPCRVWSESRASEPGGMAVVDYSISLPAFAQILNADRLAVPGWFNGWLAAENYTEGALAIPQSSAPEFYFECVQGGESGDAEPDWMNQLGAMTEDGDAVWKCAGRVSFFEVTGDNKALSSKAELIVNVKRLQ